MMLAIGSKIYSPGHSSTHFPVGCALGLGAGSQTRSIRPIQYSISFVFNLLRQNGAKIEEAVPIFVRSWCMYKCTFFA
jgi:hypothetical protein